MWLFLHVYIHVPTSSYRLLLFLSSKLCSAYELRETVSHFLLSPSDFQSSVEVADYSYKTEGLFPCAHQRASCLFLLVVRKCIFIPIVSSKSGYCLPFSTLFYLQNLTGVFPLHQLTEEITLSCLMYSSVCLWVVTCPPGCRPANHHLLTILLRQCFSNVLTKNVVWNGIKTLKWRYPSFTAFPPT